MNSLKVNRDELIEFTQKVIRAKSLSGEEHRVAQLIKEKMSELGYDEVWIDDYGSVIGKVNGTGEGPSILFDGHIDTVPVNSPEKWSCDPFGAEIVNNVMYGRGTSDMKGAVCAAVMAIGEIARDIRRTGNRPKGDIYISGTVFEEVFEGIALGKVLEQITPDYVVIMESTELNVNIGQRGRAEVIVLAHGKSAHSSNPDVGINAVYEMNAVISNIINLRPPQHSKLGKGISVVTDIISSPYPGASVVPDLCRITIDRRLLVQEDESFVINQFKQAAPVTGNFDVTIAEAELQCYTGRKLGGKRFFPAWLINEDHVLVQNALAALRDINQQPKLSVYSFCTNGSYCAGVSKIPTIGYGPSRENIAHIVNEYIELDQLFQAAEGYYSIAQIIANSTTKDGQHV